VKVLVTTTPGLGHLLPVLPLATELRARGHDLRWVAGGDSAATAEATGIPVTRAGMPVAERLAIFARRYPDAPSLPAPERRAVAFSKLFGEIAAPAMVDAVVATVRAWRPDVVVHDAAELTGPLAAAAAGIPSVCHGFGEVVPAASVRRAGQEVAPLWRAQGLEPDTYAGCYRGLYVDIYPPGLGAQPMDHVPHVQLRRPADGRPATGTTVYVTFGTVFNEVDDGFRAAVLAAAAVADDVVVTVGPSGAPDAVGPTPPNVLVQRFVPQAELLPRCGAVVCHGGSGTVLASLAHGIPLVCLPRAADQFANAANVERVGAGTALVGAAATPAALGTALEQALTAPEPRSAARALAAEIAGMPGDATVASAVERWVASG